MVVLVPLPCLSPLCWCLDPHQGRAGCAGAPSTAAVRRAVLVRGPPLWFDMLSCCWARRLGWVCFATMWPAAVVLRGVLVLGLYFTKGAVTRRQWPGCLPTGTGKRRGCV